MFVIAPHLFCREPVSYTHLDVYKRQPDTIKYTWSAFEAIHWFIQPCKSVKRRWMAVSDTAPEPISLGRLGVNVTFISETGNDKVGDIILKFMRETTFACMKAGRVFMPKISPSRCSRGWFRMISCNGLYCRIWILWASILVMIFLFHSYDIFHS